MYFIEVIGQSSRKNKDFLYTVGDFSLSVFEKKKTTIIFVLTLVDQYDFKSCHLCDS